MSRNAEIRRTTGETDIFVRIELDGKGKSSVNTGIPFLDHMLTLFARHGFFVHPRGVSMSPKYNITLPPRLSSTFFDFFTFPRNADAFCEKPIFVVF